MIVGKAAVVIRLNEVVEPIESGREILGKQTQRLAEVGIHSILGTETSDGERPLNDEVSLDVG
jgi:hypothetical protein